MPFGIFVTILLQWRCCFLRYWFLLSLRDLKRQRRRRGGLKSWTILVSPLNCTGFMWVIDLFMWEFREQSMNYRSIPISCWFLTFFTSSDPLSPRSSLTPERAVWCRIRISWTVEISHWIHLLATSLRLENCHPRELDCASQKTKHVETISLWYRKMMIKVSAMR